MECFGVIWCNLHRSSAAFFLLFPSLSLVCIGVIAVSLHLLVRVQTHSLEACSDGKILSAQGAVFWAGQGEDVAAASSCVLACVWQLERKEEGESQLDFLAHGL